MQIYNPLKNRPHQTDRKGRVFVCVCVWGRDIYIEREGEKEIGKVRAGESGKEREGDVKRKIQIKRKRRKKYIDKLVERWQIERPTDRDNQWEAKRQRERERERERESESIGGGGVTQNPMMRVEANMPHI